MNIAHSTVPVTTAPRPEPDYLDSQTPAAPSTGTTEGGVEAEPSGVAILGYN